MQYTPEPLKFLKSILNAGAEFTVFNRQNLTKTDHQLVTIQTSFLSWHGEGVFPEGFSDRVIKYPHTNIPLAQFEDILKKGYEIVYTYEDPLGINNAKMKDIIGLCYVCKIKKEPADLLWHAK